MKELQIAKITAANFDLLTMKPYAIAVSISVTTQEADLSEIKADLRDFLGYECSRAFKVQEKQHPRT